MTRAAHRILNQARASAWRRVGIPEAWPDKATQHPATTVPPASTGQNVANVPAKEQETARPEDPAADVTPDQDSK